MNDIPRSDVATDRPFFSVIISTYNRPAATVRCVDSCLAQTFPDLEVVVVDDASTDGTVAAVESRQDSRLRVVVHDVNRGINPARHTGVTHARGEWVVVVDSDWELEPFALERLHAITSDLPPHVRVVRSRLRWDDGSVTPAYMPAGPVTYEQRIRWVDVEGGYDAARCLHRSVFATTPYFADRRGAMEPLFELNLARATTGLYVEDVLGREHVDAPNSYLRSVRRAELIPRLLRDAPDTLWMAETTLRTHGDALRAHGPRQYRVMLRSAALQAFLVGQRRRGLRHGWAGVRARPVDPMLWATILLGLVGGRAVAYGSLAFRRFVARHGGR